MAGDFQLGDDFDLADHIFVAMGKMTSQMAMLTDASRRIVWVNKAFSDVTGFRPEEALGRNPGKLLQGPDSDPLAIKRMRAALDAGKSFKEEVINYRKNGESYWTEIQVEPIFGADGKLRGYFGLNQNITQRKRILDSALTRQRQLEAERLSVCDKLDFSVTAMGAVIRCSPTPIILTDPKHIITEFNPAAEALLGYKRAELVGKETPALLHDFEEVIDKARQRGWQGDVLSVGFSDLVPFFQTGDTSTEQWHLVSKNGERIPALLGLSILRNSQAETIGYMGVITDLRSQFAVEQERQTLLSRLQKVARHLPGFIYEYQLKADGSSAFPYASEGIINIYGVTPQQALEDANKVWQAIHPADTERVKKSIQQSVETGALWSCDYRVVLADGVERWVSGSANPEPQADGSILWYGYIRDITDRKQNEAALDKQSALLHLLTETALDFINVPVTEADSAIEKALSDVGCFFGMDRAYLFDYDFEAATSSNTHEWCAEGIAPFKDQLQNRPIEWDSEWYFTHQRGEVVHIPDVLGMPQCSVKDILTMQSIKSVLTVPLMHQNKPIGFVGFDAVKEKRDFSEEEILLLNVFARALVSVRLRLESHLALEESRDQLKLFFDVSVGLICVCDLQGNFLEVNHGWELFLGQPKEAINGTAFMNHVHPDDRQATEQAMAELANGQKIEGFINRFRNSEGEWRKISWVSISRNGKIYALARDVTSESEAAEALEHALEDAKRVADMRSRLISMASHEFRTPLASVRLSAEMLQMQLTALQSTLPPKVEKHLSSIVASTDHLTRITTNVLEIEGSGGHHQKMELVPLDALTICNECVETYRESSGSTRSIELNSEASIPMVRANEILLSSTMANLLDNALKYSPEDSPVAVELECDNTHVLISVKDQGMGIPEDEMDTIFDPFYRSDRTSGISGTGLGLSIVLQNIERMGGNVQVRSNTPKGTIFTLYLPIHQTEES